MSTLTVRLADWDEASQVLALLKQGLARMRADGNRTQWTDQTHSLASVQERIAAGATYLVQEQGRSIATFVLLETPDPTYAVIEGAWLREAPYVTFHSLASEGSRKGIAYFLFDWACQTFGCDLRLDTHQDNQRMQHIALRYGFRECGTIYLADGSPRKAFHYLHLLPTK